METLPNIAIIGATGAVGRECLSILEQRKFKHGTIKLLASSRSAGTKIEYRGKAHTVEELGPRSFDGVKFGFFAAGSDTVKAFAPIALAAGCTVIDKSSAHRADPKVPLVIPEVNPEAMAELKGRAGIVAVPNCSTIILLVPLTPIRKAFGLHERRLVTLVDQIERELLVVAQQQLKPALAARAGAPAAPESFLLPGEVR